MAVSALKDLLLLLKKGLPEALYVGVLLKATIALEYGGTSRRNMTIGENSTRNIAAEKVAVNQRL